MSITRVIDHARRHPRDAAAAIAIGTLTGLWLGGVLAKLVLG